MHQLHILHIFPDNNTVELVHGTTLPDIETGCFNNPHLITILGKSHTFPQLYKQETDVEMCNTHAAGFD